MSCPLTADSISAFVIGCPFTIAIVSAANAGMEMRKTNTVDSSLNRSLRYMHCALVAHWFGRQNRLLPLHGPLLHCAL